MLYYQQLTTSLLGVDTGRSHPSQKCLGHTAIDTLVCGYKHPEPEPCGGANRGVLCPPGHQWSQARPRISSFLSLLLTKATWGRKGLFELTGQGEFKAAAWGNLLNFTHSQKARPSTSILLLKSPSPFDTVEDPKEGMVATSLWQVLVHLSYQNQDNSLQECLQARLPGVSRFG